jgi:hypothetical protein
MVHPRAQAQRFRYLADPHEIAIATGERQRKCDVLLGSERGDQVERLKHESHVLASQHRQFGVAERAEIRVAYERLAGGQRVEPGGAVEERRLP